MSPNTSFDVRQRVIWHHTKGLSVRKIASATHVSTTTVHRIIQQYSIENRIEAKTSTGRPRKITERMTNLLERQVKKTPKISTPKLATLIKENFDETVNPRTVQRALERRGYRSRIARRKPCLSKVNIQKRLDFANKWVHAPESWWNRILFTDESKFNIMGSDGYCRVLRKPKTEFEKKNIRATVKHGGGSVMVWGCMSAAGVGQLAFIDGIMNKESYVELLRANLPPSVTKLNLPHDYIFFQDNDPKHKSHYARMWLLYNTPKVLDTAPQSPDLNPIENLWDHLDRQIRQHTISNKTQLKEIIQEEWNNISPAYTAKLVNSMPERLHDVINAKGGHTRF